MDSFEINKIAGAVLATALGVMGLGILAEFIYEPIEAEEPGYVIAVATPEHGEGGAGEAAPEIEPIAVRLQVASADAGASVAKKCASCHTFEQGAGKKIGPPLWDVVGRVMGSADFDYSDVMQAADATGESWTFEALDHFLAAPKAAMPGTKMAFNGLNKPDDRADIIDYLRTLSDNPVPLPAVVAADAPPADGADAPADGAAAGDAPVEEAPAEDAPVEDTPAETAPAEDAPATAD